MKLAEYRLDDGKYGMQATVTICGEDVSVQICGGELHHIGAVALAVPRPSLADADKTSASVSVLCVTGHKDDEFARMAADIFASRTGRLAVVSVGIHIDGAVREDILRLRDNFMRLVEDITAGLGMD